MTISTVLFDLDGTLLDTLGDLAAAVNNALSGLSFPLRTKEEVRSFIGNGVPTLLKRSLPCGVDGETHKKAVELFSAYYMAHINDLTVPYVGMRELLGYLRQRGINVGVVSNKKDSALQLVCKELLCGLYDYAVGPKSEAERKPAPSMVLAAMDYFGASADNTVYVGDTEVDIAVARNAGIDCISALWGYRSETELRAAGGKIFAKTPDELKEIILTLLP